MDDRELLRNLYNDAVTLLKEGKIGDVKDLLRSRFEELPEPLKAELLTRMVLKRVALRSEENAVLAAVQDSGPELFGRAVEDAKRAEQQN